MKCAKYIKTSHNFTKIKLIVCLLSCKKDVRRCIQIFPRRISIAIPGYRYKLCTAVSWYYYLFLFQIYNNNYYIIINIIGKLCHAGVIYFRHPLRPFDGPRRIKFTHGVLLFLFTIIIIITLLVFYINPARR